MHVEKSVNPRPLVASIPHVMHYPLTTVENVLKKLHISITTGITVLPTQTQNKIYQQQLGHKQLPLFVMRVWSSVRSGLLFSH